MLKIPRRVTTINRSSPSSKIFLPLDEKDKMIFVITVSQWSFIWLRVIKYLLLPVAYPALQPSSQTRLGYVSCKHVCICTRGDSSPSSVPVFHLVLFAFNSFNLPPGTCAIFLSPLLSLSLFSRVFFKPTPLKLLF